MDKRRNWTRKEHLIALHLYNQLPFGSFDQRNSEVIKYSILIGRTPSALAMKLSNLASLDPVITDSGRKGLAGASKADRLIWAEMNENWVGFQNEIYETLERLDSISTDPEITKPQIIEIPILDDYTGDEKVVPTRVRRGQARFRQAVLSSYNFRCCISGLSIKRLLVASHIIPWKDDIKNRLHPANGLSLSMIHDKAFDLGFITIDEDYRVVVSQKYHSKDDVFFNTSLMKYDGESLILPNKFSPKSEFLEHHRDTIFESKAA